MTNYISIANNNKFMNVRPEGVNPNTIVITYSVSEGDIHKTINTLYDRGASVHYTIRADGFQDQHHHESLQTFYAGKSSWHGKASVNTYGIGVMLINDATTPFSDVQIDKLIALVKDINVRHGIEMEVVGLGEVAVDRHIAPGKHFPWAKLAESGIGKSIKLPEGISKECKINLNDAGENVQHVQQNLIEHGYGIAATGMFDELTSKAVQVFTDRYVPEHNNCWSDATDYMLNELLGLDNSHFITMHSEL